MKKLRHCHPMYSMCSITAVPRDAVIEHSAYEALAWRRAVKKYPLFKYGCTLRRDVFRALCRVLSAKVVGATSSEGFLVTLRLETPLRIRHPRQ